jgi:probable F420-dependent oxidoreductase
MKFWQSLAFTEVDQLVDIARICEGVGFHGVFVADHLYYPENLESRYPYSEDGNPPFNIETEWPEVWAAISAMAAVTTTLRFTTGTYIAPLRHPLVVAKAVATASILSRGRVALGAGAGWAKEEYDQLGENFRTRGARLDEMIEILRKVWAGGMVEHHGRYYDFDRLQMVPKPPAPVPIYIGGKSEPALRRAARNDGWFGSGDDPAAILELVERLRGYRREYGRQNQAFDTIVPMTDAPEAELFRRLEDAGVDGAVSYPLCATLGPRSSLDQKRQILERYANDIMAKF